MAVALSATLTAHQRSPRRQPALSVTLAPQHFGIPRLTPFAAAADDAEPSAPIAAVVTAAGTLYRARNNAGSLQVNIAGAGWSAVDTVTAGQGLALAYDPVAAAVLLAYGDGNDLKLRTSADGFATPTTLVTEASAIGAVALAVRASNGNACAFYVLGTTTTVKRLRRTTGTWAASGTAWTKAASVASVTGLAAVHNANYFLAVTGTEVTTTNEKLWAIAFGDGSIATNTWTGLVTIAEADAAASLTFGYPSLMVISGIYFATFQQVEAGNVAASRVMLTSTTATLGPLSHWTEPFPTYQLATSHGAAIAYDAANALVYLVGPSQLATHTIPANVDVSARVLSCTWRETPTSLKVRIELAHDADIGSASVLGWDATIAHGFTTSAGAENGVRLRATVARVTRRFVSGKGRVTLDCDGPWEALARYRAPQAWTAPSGYLRSQIFGRVAGRAGLEAVEAAGDRAPSAVWGAAPTGFAIAAGERGSTTLERLLAPTPDFTRLDGFDGALTICGSFATAETATIDERWSLPQDEHPLAELAVFDQLETNWIRLQGPDRYADAFYFDALIPQGAGSPVDAIMDHVRDFSADDDTKAATAAQDALLRRQWLTPYAELSAPVNLSVELYDVVNVAVEGSYQLDPGYGRVIARGIDFKTGPTGKAEYTSVLTLGRVSA